MNDLNENKSLELNGGDGRKWVEILDVEGDPFADEAPQTDIAETSGPAKYDYYDSPYSSSAPTYLLFSNIPCTITMYVLITPNKEKVL